jgi:hypothetical protein
MRSIDHGSHFSGIADPLFARTLAAFRDFPEDRAAELSSAERPDTYEKDGSAFDDFSFFG